MCCIRHIQVYMEPKQVTVKVPRTIMEDVEVTYQVCYFFHLIL